MEGLRKFAKSRLGQFTMVLIVAPMAFLGLSGGMSGSQNPDQVVTIGEQGIGLTQLQTAVNNQKAALIRDGVDASLIKEDVLQQQILEKLINQNLLKQQADKLGLSLSDATVTAMLMQRREFQDENGKFSNDRFEMLLTSNRINKDQLFAEEKGQKSVEQLSNSILNTAIYPSSEIDKLINLQLESRDIWLYRIAWQDFQDQVSVTDKDIEDYYNQHKDTLKSIPMVDLSYIQLKADDLKVAEPTEKEIQLQYDVYKQENNLVDMRHFSHILLTGDDAKEKAIQVKQKLDAGGDFVALAKEYSVDPSKDSGGDIGRFNADMFGKDGAGVAKAIEGMQVGDVSEPVQTAYGYHLFTVTKNNTDEIPTLASLKPELLEKAIAYKQQMRFTELVSKINIDVVDGLSIQDIANQENLTVEKIANYQKTDNLTDLSQPSVITAAFDDFTLQDQAVSPVIELSDSMVWVQPSNYRPSATMSLETATPQIRALLTQQKATQLALDEAKKVVANIKAEEDIVNQGIEFTKLADLKRQNKLLSKAENSIAFSRKAPESGIVSMAVETETGASVIVANAIKMTEDEKLTNMQKLQIYTGIRQKFGDNQLSDYLHYLNTVAKVEIDQEKIDRANKGVN